MEEHFQAYFAWKSQGVRNQWCWHVDAHLDIGRLGLGPETLGRLKDCRSELEAQDAGVLGNSYLPWGGLHCGNYLYPSIQEGMVSKLTWVIPADLPDAGLLNWARRHLNSWFELELQEYASLTFKDGVVVGTLLGIPFEVGTIDTLPWPQEPVLMDIDIDYFVCDDGTPVECAQEFQRRIESIPFSIRTVAYSVKGGFTPTSERFLAEPFLGDTNGYQATLIDEVASLVSRRQYEMALQRVSEWPHELSIELNFLKGKCLHSVGRKSECLENWQAMLSGPVGSDGAGYLHFLCAELANDLQQPELALEHSLAGQKLEPNSYSHVWNEAVAWEQKKNPRKAVKALRRVVRMSEHLLFGLAARYALSRLYKKQGKSGLAQMELRKLAQLDVTGRYRPATLLV